MNPGYQGDIGWIDSVLPPTTGSRFWSTVKINPEMVKGQALLWVKGHTCTQLYASRCLGAEFVGVVRFTHTSRGQVHGRGQILAKRSKSRSMTIRFR